MPTKTGKDMPTKKKQKRKIETEGKHKQGKTKPE